MKSLARQGNAIIISFDGNTTVRDWQSSQTITNLQFFLRPLPSDSDLAMLAASIGKGLRLFGLFVRDVAEPSQFRGENLATITLAV